MPSQANYSNQPGHIVYPDQAGHPNFQPLSQFNGGFRSDQQWHTTPEQPSASEPVAHAAQTSRSARSATIAKDVADYNALLEEEDDDDLNIDTTNMTQEEKNQIKQQRKLRKMNREKLKRAKLNNQFDHLCEILAMGRTTRVEKLAVLNETIRTVCMLKAENDGFRAQNQRIKEELERRRAGTSAPPIQHAQPPVQQSQVQMQYMQPFQQKAFQEQPMKQSPNQFGWPQQPQNNNDDLDFAFGDSSDDFWTGEDAWQPQALQSQWAMQSAPNLGTDNLMNFKDFPSCAQPLDTDDSIDMFLEDGDSGLLCF
jgi:hypothetical protein